MCAAPVVNLGIYGKVPKHRLSDKYFYLNDGECLSVGESKNTKSLGSWVYDGAACLAKYVERIHLDSLTTGTSDNNLQGKRLVELGAGTGVVGLVAGYYGANSVITELEDMVPLIDHNIQSNANLMKGEVVARALKWGNDTSEFQPAPDYLILANCVYYDSSFEPLGQTMLDLTDINTKILACYEVRTQGIKNLIGRFHAIIEDFFDIEYLNNDVIDGEFKQDFVRLVKMTRKNNANSNILFE